jgi:hypothetical protein
MDDELVNCRHIVMCSDKPLGPHPFLAGTRTAAAYHPQRNKLSRCPPERGQYKHW